MAKKPTKSLSDDEFRKYSEHHLRYELDMLTWCTGVLCALVHVKDLDNLSLVINNAVMNSFSMHARNLIDFLYLRSLGKDRPTDIVVEDFISPEALADKLPGISPLLSKAKNKADKQVAHLTAERVEFEKSGKEWEFGAIAIELVERFQMISGLFSSARTSDAFLELIFGDSLRIPYIQAKVVQESQSVNLVLSHPVPQPE